MQLTVCMRFIFLLSALNFCPYTCPIPAVFPCFQAQTRHCSASRKEGHGGTLVCYPQEYPLVKTWLWPLVIYCTLYLPNEEATAPAGTRDFLVPSVHTNIKNKSNVPDIPSHFSSRPVDAPSPPLFIFLFWACICFNFVLLVPVICLGMRTRLALEREGNHRGLSVQHWTE